jgi:hypothetical protein
MIAPICIIHAPIELVEDLINVAFDKPVGEVPLLFNGRTQLRYLEALFLRNLSRFSRIAFEVFHSSS